MLNPLAKQQGDVNEDSSIAKNQERNNTLDQINPDIEKAQKNNAQKEKAEYNQRLMVEINTELEKFKKGPGARHMDNFDLAGYCVIKAPIEIKQNKDCLERKMYWKKRCCACYRKNNCFCQYPAFSCDKFCENLRISSSFLPMILWYPCSYFGAALGYILMVPLFPFTFLGSCICSWECDSFDPVCKCLECEYQSLCYKQTQEDVMYEEVLKIYTIYSAKYR